MFTDTVTQIKYKIICLTISSNSQIWVTHFLKYLISNNIQGASEIPDECLCTLRSYVFVKYCLFTIHRKINACGELLNFQKPRV